ncbi:hypothetical protein D9613_008722 [Agrocybe pediades]|uniref:Uncharacterized protein n=1 Tax=Agrocybe pediades TaxID=84607 RepID=A0A8H4VNA4_9AGAR|nr:hypothetical protein D9613_008722 [Agrocybe pediades]
MGGFMLREEGKKARVLGWRTFMKYYKQGRLDLSEITEDRINDHSKADWFAKGLALLQMFWFITQCIARFFDKHLILTEIELATAALALLSLVMYILWWNKPFNAGVPITITLLPAETDPQLKNDANSRSESVLSSIDTSLPFADPVNPFVPDAQLVEVTQPSDYGVDEASLLRQSDPGEPTSSRSGSAEVNDGTFSQTLRALRPSPESDHPRVHLLSDGSSTSPLPSSDPVNPNIPHAQPVEATHPCDDGVDVPSVQINLHLRESVRTVEPPASRSGSAEVSNITYSQVLPYRRPRLVNCPFKGLLGFPGLPPSAQSAHPQIQVVSGSQPADHPPRSPSIRRGKPSDGFQLWFLFVRIEEIMTNADADWVDHPDYSAATSVPSFYSVNTGSGAAYCQLLLTSFFAAVLFGSIHCIGWSSKIMFTSYTASLAWRIASVIITVGPVVWCLGSISVYAGDKSKDGSLLKEMFEYVATLCSFVSVTTIPVYIVARLALLVLTLVELQYLPPGALASIQWANVVPFIH